MSKIRTLREYLKHANSQKDEIKFINYLTASAISDIRPNYRLVLSFARICEESDEGKQLQYFYKFIGETVFRLPHLTYPTISPYSSAKKTFDCYYL